MTRFFGLYKKNFETPQKNVLITPGLRVGVVRKFLVAKCLSLQIFEKNETFLIEFKLKVEYYTLSLFY